MTSASNPKSNSSFVTNVDIHLAEKLKADLIEMGFELNQMPYTIFSAKKKGVSCTLYQSGKMMVQGSEMKEFIEFYLEPQILKNVSYTQAEHLLDLTARIGVDESGKGDFFGPLCVAGFYAEGNEIKELHSLGVKDSKDLSDASILKLAKKLREKFQYHVIVLTPKRYNELYQSFNNLNSLLAWGHSTIIETMINKTGCKNVIIDQFAKEGVVLSALKRKKINIPLIQKHRAEEDLVVAAASILARAAFLENLEILSNKIETKLPKGGAKITIEIGKKLLISHGTEVFSEIAKTHFKNFQDIIHN
jgi:ribonuclease HIII